MAGIYALATACGPHGFRHLGRGGIVDIDRDHKRPPHHAHMCMVGRALVIPVSAIIFCSHVVSVAASAAAIYSAWHVLFTTTGCCFVSHCTGRR